jgi:RimJ/RimL family protein N-acetyltransferase
VLLVHKVLYNLNVKLIHITKGGQGMNELKLPNGERVEIRPARWTDASELIEYLERISDESDNLTFGPGEFGITVEQEEDFLDNISKQNNAIYIVAHNEEKIVGSLSFTGGSRPRIAHTGEFGVSVLKEYWGNGIGTELIKYLLEWCKKSGVVRKVNLRVRTDNFNAIHVYKKLGFIEEGVITREFLINSNFYDTLSMGICID